MGEIRTTTCFFLKPLYINVNKGINYKPQLLSQISEPSTVGCPYVSSLKRFSPLASPVFFVPNPGMSGRSRSAWEKCKLHSLEKKSGNAWDSDSVCTHMSVNNSCSLYMNRYITIMFCVLSRSVHQHDIFPTNWWIYF